MPLHHTQNKASMSVNIFQVAHAISIPKHFPKLPLIAKPRPVKNLISFLGLSIIVNMASLLLIILSKNVKMNQKAVVAVETTYRIREREK